MRIRILLTCMVVFVSTAAVAQQTPVSDPGGEQVVVSQGGASVDLEDVDAFSRSVPEDARAQTFADPHMVERVLRSLLLTKQLAGEARNMKLDKDPVVAAEMAQAGDKVLAQERMEALRKEYSSHIPDQSELARERYMANPADYDVARVVDVKHILIDPEKHKDEDAGALAEKLYRQLRANPSDFDADVEKYSDDDTKSKNHGLVPDATSRRYVQEFRDAAEKLTQVDEISAPVKSQFGYHIIKVVKIVPAHKRSFDEVKAALVAKLEKDYVDRKVQDHVDGLRSKALDADMDLVKSLTTRYADKAAAESGKE